MRRCLGSCALALLAATAPGQIVIERFSYPDGPRVPGWVPLVGTWAIKGGRLVVTGGAESLISAIKLRSPAGVVDIDVFFGSGTGPRTAGLVARHPGVTNMVKLIRGTLRATGSQAGAFGEALVEERPGRTQVVRLAAAAKAARVRLSVLGKRAWIEVDADRDGRFEARRDTPLATVLTPGFMGITGSAGCAFDDFRFYDALMAPDGASVPKIGTTFKMLMTAPDPPLFHPIPWLAYASLANTGIGLGDGRMLPLAVDPLLLVSGGFGWLGLLNNHEARFSIPIPNDATLAGFGFFVAGFTIDDMHWTKVGSISNDLYVRIVK